MPERSVCQFEQAAREHREPGFVRELWGFLCHNKKWWLLPLLIVFCLFGALLWLSSTGAGPFLYTLF
jgi:hypothetical protein